MAKGPIGSGGGSTVAQPVGSQTQPTVTQRALTALRRQFFTAEDLKNPEQLYRVIYDQGQAISVALRQLAELPIGGGNLLTGVIFNGAGQTLYLQHRLGRAYRGWWCTRVVGPGAASFIEAPLPANVTAAQVLPLTSANAGQYDLYVF